MINNKKYALLALCLLLFSPIYSIDPNTVIATVNTGVNPAGIGITPNNKFAYVANNNNYDIEGQDSVTVIDLSTDLPVTTIMDDSFNAPFTVTINARGTMAYVTNSGSTTISIIDTSTNEVVGVIGGFDGPSGMVIDQANNHAYVSNFGSAAGVGSGNGTTVRVVDLNTNMIVGSPITVGKGPQALAITPDEHFVYVANYVDGNAGTGTVSVISTSNNTVGNTITGFSGPFDIAITPNGRFAYVTNFGSNNFAPFGTTVSVINLHNNTIVDTIEVGIQPSGVAITPDSKFVYVTNFNTLYAGPDFTDLTAGQGTVSIISVSQQAVVPPTIAVDQSPANIAITSNGAFALVSNYTSNTVSVITLKPLFPQSFKVIGKACKIKEHDGHWANKLIWKAVGTFEAVNYSIYRDKKLTDLVAVVPATQPFVKYIDRHPSKKQEVYYIVGTDNQGNVSQPGTLKVQGKCKDSNSRS